MTLLLSTAAAAPTPARQKSGDEGNSQPTEEAVLTSDAESAENRKQLLL